MKDGIAIIGMSGRFPGARNTAEFWRNLSNGVESISFFTAEEMAPAGVPASTVDQPNFVNAGGVLDDIDLFDAHFFGLNARDAEIMDPQQRLFLECAWESLEDAGYNPETYPGSIGVYAGTSMSTYAFNIYAEADRLPHLDHMQVLILNDKDHLTTHVSYKLNLRGPSMAVQTACSTSLVAVCIACDALWNQRCDMALAGATAISIPQRKGYMYQPGGILSPDGHCRAFDASAKGTIAGNGIGVVVLKRASQAVADGDHIYAVIKGAAVNNDGNLKVGYTAPSVEGQAKVIEMAQKMAQVAPETITYVEAHGTATQLGDPIEVAALTQAFRQGTDKKGFCAIGSVKTNIGHLDPAAGVAGLIKTALSIEHRLLPPSLHFRKPNPEIDFAGSPFYVNTRLSEWRTAEGVPLRAGVSSFGIGGTNAHCVLEEAPATEPSGPCKSHQLLLLSGRTKNALQIQTSQLAQFLRENPAVNLADVAHVYRAGRKAFAHRRMLMLPAEATPQSAAAMLDREASEVLFSNKGDARERPIYFLFSGQGTQYVDMARELYDREPLFREYFEECCDHLRSHTDFDLLNLLYPSEGDRAQASARLTRTAVTQPALFAVEYALARLWMRWGVQPQAMLGHSIGEYVAACLAGVLQLPDALALVALRGAVMDSMPAGAMLAVPLSETEARSLLNRTLCLAANNGPSACVLSGSVEDIEQVERQLATRGLLCRRLATSHAFHSAMMDSAVAPFVAGFRGVRLRAPQIPFLSNVTGTWITSEEATSPEYWGRHLRQTVRFADGVRTLLQDPDSILLEIGPGHTLGSLVHMEKAASDRLVLSTLRAPQDPQTDTAFLLATVGKLWLSGAPIDWSGFSSSERRRRLSLPTYPFEGQRYWIGPPDKQESSVQRRPVADWFYEPVWSPAERAPARTQQPTQNWLLLGQPGPLAGELTKQLESLGHQVTLSSQDAAQELALNTFQQIIDLSLFSQDPADQRAFWNLVQLAQSLGKQPLLEGLQISIVADHLHSVLPEDQVSPAKALALGPCRVIPQEYPSIICRSIDVPAGGDPASLASLLVHEITTESPAPAIAYRDGTRWTQSFEPVTLKEAPEDAPLLRKKGVYLITGGLGGIGLTLAGHLAKTVQAKLVLTGRSAPDDFKLQAVREMEEAGAEVMVVAADAANHNQMSGVVSTAVQRFGPIDGVIHSAGIAGGGMIQLKSREAATAVLAPKVEGVQILEELLRNQPLRFFAICSSLASIYGGFGQVDYCAANNYLDAFARAHSTPARPFISICWDTWREVGMAVNTEVPPELQQSREESLKRGIAPDEGVQAFLRILEARLSHVAVCTTDLQASLQENSAQAAADQDTSARPESVRAAHPRPALATPYVSPRTECEEIIAGMWQDLLGVGPIGVHDNFFELGGHSLLAVQMISQMRAHFEVEMTVQSLFDLTTVAKLAGHVESITGELSDLENMARLIEQVERLSEGEVRALLDNGQSMAEST